MNTLMEQIQEALHEGDVSGARELTDAYRHSLLREVKGRHDEDNAELLRELIRMLDAKQSEIDALKATEPKTGLLNGKAFNECIERVARHLVMVPNEQCGDDERREPSPVVDKSIYYILSIDMNGFSAINDYLGHDAGDVAIDLVANALRASTRSEGDELGNKDIVARTGGDEFAVLMQLNHDSTEQAHEQMTAIYERIQSALTYRSLIYFKTVNRGALAHFMVKNPTAIDFNTASYQFIGQNLDASIGIHCMNSHLEQCERKAEETGVDIGRAHFIWADDSMYNIKRTRERNPGIGALAYCR